jgi:hypothetical protein
MGIPWGTTLPPRFFISVASKRFRLGVSSLQSTLAAVL